MTGTEAQFLSLTKNNTNTLTGNKKANIHDIIKREINLKQGNIIGGGKQLLSNQPSPIKGLCEQYENYRGIDLSSQRSPFKQVNKQLQAQADGMPLETESNVNDDAQEQQESHIDLINETARMKHLAMNQELRNQMNQMIEQGLIVPGTEHQFINSPKINIYNVVGQVGKSNQDTQLIQYSQGTAMRNTVINSYYEKGQSKLSRKGNGNQHNKSQGSNHSGKSSKRGSITAYGLNPSISMHPLTHSVPDTKLELCQKCIKKLIFEEKSRLNQSPSTKKGATNMNDVTQIEEESHEFYYEKIRFLIVDCRWESLQKESILPNSLQLQIPQECTKEFLQGLAEKLQSCKDIYHICLVGLDPITEKIINKFETNQHNTNGEDLLDIGAYHESILRFFIEDLQKKGFKHISMIPGGYSEIHETALRYNFSLVHHDQKNCYHCEKARYERKEGEKSELLYNKQFSIVGLNDILSGFKNWYDLANLKIQNLVKGGNEPSQKEKNEISATKRQVINLNQPSQQPQLQQSTMNQTHTGLQFTHRQQQKQIQSSTFDSTNALGGVGGGNSTGQGQHFLGLPSKLATHTHIEQSDSSSYGDQIYSNITNVGAGSNKHESSRNQGPHIQNNKNHVKTTDNMVGMKGQTSSVIDNRQARIPGNQVEPYTNMAIASNNNNLQRPVDDLEKLQLDQLNMGSLPLSFVTQSSRQDNINRFQSGACSSNASVNSSQNDGGNNLRDAISNKKIMSYKLMSKVPGDPMSLDISPIQPNQGKNQKESAFQQPQEQSDTDQMKQGSLISSNNSSQGEPLVKSETTSDIPSPFSSSTLQPHQSTISGEGIVQNSNASQAEVDQQLNDIKILLSPPGNEAVGKIKSGNSFTPSSQQEESARIKQLPVQQTARTEVAFDSEGRSQAKEEEKRGQVVNPQTPDEEIYYANGLLKQVEVTLPDLESVISKKSNIVYRAMKLHLKKKPDTQLTSGASSQSVSSSSYPSIAYPVYLIITQYTVSVVREVSRKRALTADDWDQNDFEELQPLSLGSSKDKQQAAKQPQQQPTVVALIESRFLMYDLIKITSRKSSAKIITFYFRVPLLAEYNAQLLEQGLLQQLDQRPSIKYQFAFKRKNYHEVSASFEFSKEDDAKQCIANVSSLYKKLKNTKV